MSTRCGLCISPQSREAVELFHNLASSHVSTGSRGGRDQVYLLQLVFPVLQVKVSSDDGVFTSKLDNLGSVKVVEQPGINFTRELQMVSVHIVSRRRLSTTHLVEELIQQFNVDEHCRCVSQLVGHHVEEGFRTKDITLWPKATSL